jgi:hypothetical protein
VNPVERIPLSVYRVLEQLYIYPAITIGNNTENNNNKNVKQQQQQQSSRITD